MKKIFKYILVAPLAILPVAMTGCSDTDAEKDKGKTPQVSYFRYTEPGSEHITEAYLGETIAICGSDLGDVQQVWFNDQKALLNPAYITSEAIIVDVPNAISDNVTNTVRLVTSGGETATVDFYTKVPDPVVSSMSCEWANPGDVVDINGDYFVTDSEYPIQITFPGGATVAQDDILSFSRTKMTVKVPQGADQEGRPTVTTRYGEGMATFVYRDSRAMIFDWDGVRGTGLALANGWRKGDKITYSDFEGIIPSLDGKFICFNGTKADYNDMGEDQFSFCHWPIDENNISSLDISTLFDYENFDKYCLKFEAFVPSSCPWTICSLNIMFTPLDIFGENDYYFGEEDPYPYPRAMWTPWNENGGTFDTADKWVTVSIPLTDLTKDRYMNPCARKMTKDDFHGLSMIVSWGPFSEATKVPVTIALDNIRLALLSEPLPEKPEEK